MFAVSDQGISYCFQIAESTVEFFNIVISKQQCIFTMFQKLFARRAKKNPNSKQYRWEMARQMSNHHIRYVTEKINDVDEVIGRNGGLNVRDDELLVFASADVIFRCKVEQMQAWELLSKDGVVITAPDLEHGGKERTIIVYYVYYR